LIERKLGVISLVDEEAKMKNGNDESLLLKMHKSCTELHGTDASNFYIKPRVQNGKFGIKHYAGDVMYESVGMVEKNKDGFREDLVAIMHASENDFMFDMFEVGLRDPTPTPTPTFVDNRESLRLRARRCTRKWSVSLSCSPVSWATCAP
jgi:myosin heavy subunit